MFTSILHAVACVQTPEITSRCESSRSSSAVSLFNSNVFYMMQIWNLYHYFIFLSVSNDLDFIDTSIRYTDLWICDFKPGFANILDSMPGLDLEKQAKGSGAGQGRLCGWHGGRNLLLSRALFSPPLVVGP